MALGKWYDNLRITKEIKDKEGTDRSLSNRLENFIELVKPILDRQQWYQKIAYTPHDFTHHVQTVLQYGSALLGDSCRDVFDLDELLAFQYATVLHDIDMTYNPYGRMVHSLNGAEDVYEAFSSLLNDKDLLDSIMEAEGHLNDVGQDGDPEPFLDYVKDMLNNAISLLIPDEMRRRTIAKIIVGHSDIKREEGEPIDTLSAGIYYNFKGRDIDITDRHIRILAATLRMADELDITVSRKKDIPPFYVPEEGKKYWLRLDLFDKVEIKLPSIKIRVNDDFIKSHARKSYCYKLMKEVLDKIEQERQKVVRCYEEEDLNCNINVKLLFKDDDIKKEYYESIEEEEKRKQEQSEKSKQEQPENIEELKKKIETRINEKNLFCEGHYRIGDKGMRSVLDCNGLLSDPEILDGISQAFINNIATKSFLEKAESFELSDKYLLVGVANSGVLIASYMATITGLPMLYYVPQEKTNHYSKKEKEWKEYLKGIDAEKAVLIIGASVSGNAILKANDFLKEIFDDSEKKMELDAVIGIVNRDKKHEENLKKKLGENVRLDFLIDDYQVEWCSNTDCPYGKKCEEMISE